MTARFLTLHDTPDDPETFDRHYRETHIPLASRLPRLRCYTVSRDAAVVRGAPCYLVAELEWDTMDDLRAAFASPRTAQPPPMRHALRNSPRYGDDLRRRQERDAARHVTAGP